MTVDVNPVPWFIQETFSAGTTFTPIAHSTHIYTPGGRIERVIGSFVATRDDGDFLALVAACEPTINPPGPAHKQAWLREQTDWDVKAGSGAWPSGMRYVDNLYIAWQRINTDVTVDADTTIWWGNLVVFHERYNYASGLVDTTVGNGALDVRGLVHDLIGRGVNGLVEFDPQRVAPGTTWRQTVPHAAWWNGVSAREVLAFATAAAPAMWWAVWDPGPSGLPRFEVGRWDGPVRYVLPAGTTKLEMSGGAADVANRCLVRYVGTSFGASKTVWVAEVRANVRTLARTGTTRTMLLDLTGEGLMTTETARARGLTALRLSSLAKTAGRATITGPIYDHVEGRMVEPWEVRAGSPVIVCDAPLSFGRSTSLTESVGADGISVFRARSMNYEASSNSATLDLDGGSRSLLGRLKTDGAQRRYDVGNPQV